MMKQTVWAIIRTLNKKDKDTFLFGKRSSKVNNSGLWGFFGGTVDEGENLRTALKRELFEESGLRAIRTRQLFTVVKNGKQFTYFEVTVENAKVKLNKETSKYKFLTYKDTKTKKLHYPAKLFLKRIKTQQNLQFRLQMVNGSLQQKVMAMVKDKVVGGVTITLPNGAMHDLFVDKKFRNMGIASSIMDYAMTLPVAPVKLTAQASAGSGLSGKSLVDFYSKWGFQVVAGDETLARMERRRT